MRSRMISLQYSILAAVFALGFGAYRAQMPLGRAARAFHLVNSGSRTLLVTPEGGKLWLRALDQVHVLPEAANPSHLAPGSLDRRSSALVREIRDEGFNALGANADPELWHRGMPYIQSLHLTRLLEGSQGGSVVNVYAHGFAAQVRQLAMDACAPRADDLGLIGYVSDDTLPWDPAKRAASVLAFYLRQPTRTPARQRAVDYLQDLYQGDIRKLDRRWGIQAALFPAVQAPPHPTRAERLAIAADAARFADNVLVRYLRVAADAVHEADPYHLFLGATLRFEPAKPPRAGSAQAEAWMIADVNSVFILPGQNAPEVLASLARLTPRPVLAVWQGCGPPPAGGPLAAPQLIGFEWSPGGDWRHGRCALAARAWSQLRPSVP
jgi:hypothetical protein